jgi:hypothetical protein
MRLRLRVLILAELAVWAGGRGKGGSLPHINAVRRSSTGSVTVDAAEPTGIHFDPAAVALAFALRIVVAARKKGPASPKVGAQTLFTLEE